MGSDTSEATAAAQTQTGLQRSYAAVGLPALQGNMAYLRGAIKQGEPGYVANAYQGAQTGALESASQQMTGARGQLVKNLAANGGGAFLGGLGKIQGQGSASLSNEVSHIATTRALAGVEQRNKLMNLMAGNGATATNLSAGFGQLTNEGLGLSSGQNGTFGAITGGLSALSSIYANSQINANGARNALAFNPNANTSGGPDQYGNYRGGGGNVNLTTG